MTRLETVSYAIKNCTNHMKVMVGAVFVKDSRYARLTESLVIRR